MIEQEAIVIKDTKVQLRDYIEIEDVANLDNSRHLQLHFTGCYTDNCLYYIRAKEDNDYFLQH